LNKKKISFVSLKLLAKIMKIYTVNHLQFSSSVIG
jgi:hypothetical protein